MRTALTGSLIIQPRSRLNLEWFHSNTPTIATIPTVSTLTATAIIPKSVHGRRLYRRNNPNPNPGERRNNAMTARRLEYPYLMSMVSIIRNIGRPIYIFLCNVMFRRRVTVDGRWQNDIRHWPMV